MLYQSEVRASFNENRYFPRVSYLVPAQLSLSLNYPIGAIDARMKYYHSWAKYRGYYDSLQTIRTNDLMVEFFIPINGNTKFYLGFYTIPLSYTEGAKGFGLGLGPQLSKATFLKEILIFYETGESRGWDTLWHWQLLRYGIRFGFVM